MARAAPRWRSIEPAAASLCYERQTLGAAPDELLATNAAWEVLHRGRLPRGSAAPWIDIELGSVRATALIAVPEDLPCFRGHFPGAPILPGVLQLLWAETLVAAWLPDCRLSAVRQLKFRQPVAPPAVLKLVLDRQVGTIAARAELPEVAVADWSFVCAGID